MLLLLRGGVVPRAGRQDPVQHGALQQQGFQAALHGHCHQLIHKLHHCWPVGAARNQALELQHMVAGQGRLRKAQVGGG